jgi:predicted heme/steroid binding protein
MSVVIGLKQDGKVYMAADSYAGADHKAVTLADPKMFRKRDMIIGVCGSVRVIDVISSDFTPPTKGPRKKIATYMKIDVVNALFDCLERNGLLVDNQEEGVNTFNGEILIGYNGELYDIDSSFACSAYQEHFAGIGSASDIALGSLATTARYKMKPENRLILALEIAEKLSTEARGPFLLEIL